MSKGNVFFPDVCFEYKEKQMVMFPKMTYGYNFYFFYLDSLSVSTVLFSIPYLSR
jgi:hypothetical protein